MLVMKFGGTSLADAECVRRAADLTAERLERRPVVVVSAHAGVTDALLAECRASLDRPPDLAPLRDRHGEILAGLDLPEDLLDDAFEELEDLLRGIHLVGEATPRSLDAAASFGERCSSRILAAALRGADVRAEAVDAGVVGLVTDDRHTAASPLPEADERLRDGLTALMEAAGGEPLVPVVTGFTGCTVRGEPTTLGRNGSDWSASIIGAALRADEIQIWTDVDGVMTADPRLVETARPIAAMSFDEAGELAYFGGRVLHPSTLLPAVRAGVPVRVLNTLRSDGPGTVITAEPDAAPRPVRAIGHRTGVTLVDVVSTRMLLSHGFLARLFEVFDRHEIVIDMVATSEVSVSCTTDHEGDLGPVLDEIGRFADVTIERDQAIVCVVGEGIRSTPGIAGRIFGTTAAADVNVRLISQGANRINVGFLVAQDRAADTVRALHREFFEEGDA